MEIVASKVSVYEVELDLRNWNYSRSDQVKDLDRKLRDTMATLSEHKCMPGEAGGFLLEVAKGTNFAHIIEHVLLELIHLADVEGRTYTGWTRKKSENNAFVIHYSAPDFLTGRLAAILAVDIVKKLIQDENIDLNQYLNTLKKPLRYFTQGVPQPFSDLAEPASVIQEIESSTHEFWPALPSAVLPDEQIPEIQLVLKRIRRHFPYIVELWSESFLAYSGNFGRAIIDKIELINLDKHVDILIAGDFWGFYSGIRNLSQVICAYRIPANFVVHSLWLYKNRLLSHIIQEFEEERDILHRAIKNFEDFYQLILRNVSEGFARQGRLGGIRYLSELREFRELKESKACILIIDDDEMVRRASRDILEYHGYTILLAKDGPEALEIFSANRDEISLIIVDLVLPGLSGKEVYSAIRVIKPNVKIIVSSGYPLDKTTEEFISRDLVNFIKKPFETEVFLSLIQFVLDERPETAPSS